MTTHIIIQFDRPVAGFTLDHIQLTPITGSADKVALSGFGSTYRLDVTNVTEGTAKLVISNFGGFNVTTPEFIITVEEEYIPPKPPVEAPVLPEWVVVEENRTNSIVNIAFNNGIFLASYRAKDSNLVTVFRSEDGVEWEETDGQILPITNHRIRTIYFVNDKFILFKSPHSLWSKLDNIEISTSVDGIVWEDINVDVSNAHLQLFNEYDIYGNNEILFEHSYISQLDKRVVNVTEDGINWETHDLNVDKESAILTTFKGFVYSVDRFIVQYHYYYDPWNVHVGLAKSFDGINWETSEIFETWLGLYGNSAYTYGNGLYAYAFRHWDEGQTQIAVYTSSDLKSWEYIRVSGNEAFSSYGALDYVSQLHFADGTFVLSLMDESWKFTIFATTKDFKTWETYTSNEILDTYLSAFGNNRFVFGGLTNDWRRMAFAVSRLS